MSEKIKSRVAAIIAATSLFAMQDPDQIKRLRDWANTDDFIKRTSVLDQHRPPSGTKEYFFDKFGDFATEGTRPMLRAETVFWCYAINDKNAKRKFEKWRKQNPITY